jgi:hypothetical protein
MQCPHLCRARLQVLDGFLTAAIAAAAASTLPSVPENVSWPKAPTARTSIRVMLAAFSAWFAASTTLAGGIGLHFLADPPRPALLLRVSSIGARHGQGPSGRILDLLYEIESRS